jgi:hypothetical protein
VSPGSATPPLGEAFYAISDSTHFLGAVALLNSLRLVGHREPIFLADAGLSPEQRDMIASHVTLIPAPRALPPVFLKMFGPLKHPARVAVLLDADLIAVRPLTELIEAARGGRLVAFVNNEPNHDRFFEEWSNVLGLGPLRRQPYLAAGQLFVPDSLSGRLLETWKAGQAKIDIQRTRLGKATLSDPFYFADMDVFNAVVSSQLQPDEILALEHRLAPHPPFVDLALVDKRRLLCRYPDGTRPFILHHILAKPWLKATQTNIYSALLPRVLLAPDVTLRLAPEQLPLRLREGRLAFIEGRRANAQALLWTQTRQTLGRLGIRTRLARWRRARTRG